MENLPNWLRPTNSHLFLQRNIERLVPILREQIFVLLITRDTEEDYFDLELARRSNAPNVPIENLQNCLEPILRELRELGWNTRLSFGNTGLFIYSTEQPPRICW